MDKSTQTVTGEGNAPRDVVHTVPATDFVREACNNYESVKAQRDELLAALREIAEVAYADESQYVRIAKAAIAKAEGRAQ